MFSEEYLNRKAIEIRNEMQLCLNQIYALGEVCNEERFRYQQLWKKADGLSHKLSRYQLGTKLPSITKLPLPEDLDEWLAEKLMTATEQPDV